MHIKCCRMTRALRLFQIVQLNGMGINCCTSLVAVHYYSPGPYCSETIHFRLYFFVEICGPIQKMLFKLRFVFKAKELGTYSKMEIDKS